MPIKIENIVRKFTYNGVDLPDPNPALNVNEVQGVLANTHPELANAAIDGPKAKGNVHTYTFVKSVGEKG
jgi:PRTRC genetic system protein C